MDSWTASQMILRRSNRRRFWNIAAFALTCAVLVTGVIVPSQGDETASPGELEISDEVPSFYVRAVTGPLAGKSVCYVCRNGDRPAVIVLLRELGDDSTALLKQLDQVVNEHRAEGLRCFAVLLTENPQRDAARLQTMAFDEKIALPLTLASHATIQGSILAFPRESAVSVITYSERKIVQRFSFPAGACDDKSRKSVIVASQKLLAPN